MIHLVADCILSLADCQQCVLVFLPGTGEIRGLETALEEQLHSLGGCSKLGARLCVMALHSMVSREEQDAAFDEAPPDACKVILATNIAESSITLPDVHYVVDLGLHRHILVDRQRSNLACLVRLCCTSFPPPESL